MAAAFPDRVLHVVIDNLNTHKKNERWLKKHPKVHFHFTPTQSSWLNQVETRFTILQGQSLDGASFTTVEQLQKHITAFVAAYNQTASLSPGHGHLWMKADESSLGPVEKDRGQR